MNPPDKEYVVFEDEAGEISAALWDDLYTIEYGHDGTFYWYETPDGVRGRSLTRGKMLAALSAVRIRFPEIKLQLVGKLPKRKEKK